MTRRDLFKLASKVGLVAVAQQVPWALLEKVGLRAEYFAEAAALPSNRNVQTGTLLWTPRLANVLSSSVLSGDAAWTMVEDNTVWKRPASAPGSLKFTVGAGTTTPTYRVRANLAQTVTLNQLHSVHMPLYREQPSGGAWTVAVSLLDAGLANGYRWNFIYPNVGQQPRVGFFGCGLKAAPDSLIGAPTGSTSLTRLDVFVYNTAGQTGTWYVGPLYMNWYTRPQIVFTLDDGYVGDYENAYAYMQPRGLVGSLAVNSNRIDTATYVTTANLTTMQTNGWSIHNHTADHDDFNVVTDTAKQTTIESCRNWLEARGLHASGDQVFVLPFGNNSLATEAVVKRSYPYSAVAAEGAFGGWDGIPDPYLLFRYTHDSPVSSATVIAAINTAVEKGRSIILYGHNVNQGVPGGTYTAYTTFTAIVNHVKQLVDSNIADNPNLQRMVFALNSGGRRRRGI